MAGRKFLDMDLVLSMHRNGFSARKIAYLFGVGYRTISRRIAEEKSEQERFLKPHCCSTQGIGVRPPSRIEKQQEVLERSRRLLGPGPIRSTWPAFSETWAALYR